MYFTWITCFLFLIFGKKNIIIRPDYIFIYVWFLISSTFIVVNFYSISYETDILISLSLIMFCIPHILKFDTKLNLIEDYKYNRSLKLCIILLIIFFPIYLYNLLVTVDFDYKNIIGIRNSMTEQNHINKLNLFISIGINFPIILSIYFSCVYKQCNKHHILILYIICLIYVLFSFSKGYYLMFFLQNIFILRVTKVINNKKFFHLALLTILFIILSVILRDSFVDNKLLFVMYVISPIAALDLLVNDLFSLNIPSISWLLPVFYLFNIPTDQSRSVFYTQLNEPTNVFTVFGSYFNDLGFFGVLIIFLIYGFFSSYVYSRVNKTNSKIYLFLYSWICYGIAVSFFSDGLLGSAQTFLKYLFIIYVIDYILNNFKFLR